MDYIIITITCLTLLVALISLLLGIKWKRKGDLYDEVHHYQNARHMLDAWILRSKSLDAIIQFCNTHINYTDKNEIKDAMQFFKQKAERLKKWYIFW